MTDVPPLAPLPPTEEPRPHPLRAVLVAVVVFLVLLLATFGLKSYRDLAAVRGREHLLLSEIAGTEERIAQVAFETPPKDVSIGEMSEITLRQPVVKQALAVPSAALRLRGGKTGVWVLRDDKPGFVPVKAGISGADGRVQILDGLKEGDAVIVHSERDLTEDSRIRVVSAIAAS